MRYLDLENWPRREHYTRFTVYNNPHFGVSSTVDVTALREFLKQHSQSFTIAIVYLMARAANAIPEFRHRILGGRPVEHERVDPSFTVLVEEEQVSFCVVEYVEDFAVFAARAAEKMAYVRASSSVAQALEEEGERTDLLYLSAIPWMSFTGFMHAVMGPADSIPLITWGKFFEHDGLLQMPLAVQGHHALMDGLHMGKFYILMEQYLKQPVTALGGE
jgi:chloramphenicol O-acetyltransferase type A